MQKLSIIADLNISRKNDVVRQNEISADKSISICVIVVVFTNLLVSTLSFFDVYTFLDICMRIVRLTKTLLERRNQAIKSIVNKFAKSKEQYGDLTLQMLKCKS